MEDAADRNFVLRPTPGQKFRVKHATALVQEVLTEKLAGLATYDVDEADALSRDISATIRERLKGLQLPRYKYVVQTTLAEQSGNGATTAVQCVWDEDCDAYVNQRYVTVGGSKPSCTAPYFRDQFGVKSWFLQFSTIN